MEPKPDSESATPNAPASPSPAPAAAAPSPSQVPDAQVKSARAAEAAVLDEMAAMKKQLADVAAFVGFGKPPPAPPAPEDKPAQKPRGLCWFHPFTACPPHSDCPVTA